MASLLFFLSGLTIPFLHSVHCHFNLYLDVTCSTCVIFLNSHTNWITIFVQFFVISYSLLETQPHSYCYGCLHSFCYRLWESKIRLTLRNLSFDSCVPIKKYRKKSLYKFRFKQILSSEVVNFMQASIVFKHVFDPITASKKHEHTSS